MYPFIVWSIPFLLAGQFARGAEVPDDPTCLQGAADLHSPRWVQISVGVSQAWSDPSKHPQLLARLNWGLSQLSERDSDAYRFFHGLDGPPKTVEEIALHFKVSKPTARRYVDSAERSLQQLDQTLGLFDLQKDLTPFLEAQGAYGVPIRLLPLDESIQKLLLREGVVNAGQLCEFSPQKLQAIRGMGDGRVNEVIRALDQFGYRLQVTQMSWPDLIQLDPKILWGEKSAPSLLPLPERIRNVLRSLEDRFPSIRSLAGVSEAELRALPSIGEQTAAEIVEMIHNLKMVVPIPE